MATRVFYEDNFACALEYFNFVFTYISLMYDVWCSIDAVPNGNVGFVGKGWTEFRAYGGKT